MGKRQSLDTKQPLLDEPDESRPLPSANKVLLSFWMMAICFSLNHGTVTALIALAAPSKGNLGRYCIGTLYVMYTVVALFFSTLIVGVTGHKWGLVMGLGVYCFYVTSFMISYYAESIQEEASIIGSAIGGIAAGFLWTAQGGYFAHACQLYAAVTNTPKEGVTSMFGGIFAAIYLSGEVALKLLSSALEKIPHGGEEVVFVTFSVVAIASTAGMALIHDLEQYHTPGAPARVKGSISAKILDALKLLFSDPKMALLLPAQISFGFMSAFLNSYVNSNVVKEFLGKSNVGYLAAITAGTAAVLSVPLGWLTKRISKVYIMVLGGAIFVLEASVFLAYTDAELGKWEWAVLIYMLHGVGRGVWESTNKAVMGDFFPNNAPAAFANVIMSSGSATSVGFFVFPNVKRSAQIMFGLVFAVLHVFCSVFAFNIWNRQKKRTHLEPFETQN